MSLLAAIIVMLLVGIAYLLYNIRCLLNKLVDLVTQQLQSSDKSLDLLSQSERALTQIQEGQSNTAVPLIALLRSINKSLEWLAEQFIKKDTK
jgi:hypothetical protein